MKTVLIAFATFLCMHASAQDSTVKSIYHHELGVDAGPFLSQFIGRGSGSFWTSNYSLMYRYHFDNIAIRARVGGFADNDDYTTNDTIKNTREEERLYGRIGIERKVDFKKRWQFFYGIDFVAETRSQNSLSDYGNEERKNRSHIQSYGAAPLIGFRFKINDRISVSTESSYGFFYTKTHEESLSNVNYQWNRVLDGTGFETDFYPPIFLFFHFNF